MCRSQLSNKGQIWPCPTGVPFLAANATTEHFVYGPCLLVPEPSMGVERQQGRAGFETRPWLCHPLPAVCFCARHLTSLSLPLEGKAMRDDTPASCETWKRLWVPRGLCEPQRALGGCHLLTMFGKKAWAFGFPLEFPMSLKSCGMSMMSPSARPSSRFSTTRFQSIQLW